MRAALGVPGAAGFNGCVLLCGMSSRPSPWSRPQDKTAGERPSFLKEPEPPVAVCLCSSAPSLVVPTLVSSCEGIDGATLSFLVQTAVLAQAEVDRRKREEEVKKLHAELVDTIQQRTVPSSSSSSFSSTLARADQLRKELEELKEKEEVMRKRRKKKRRRRSQYRCPGVLRATVGVA